MNYPEPAGASPSAEVASDAVAERVPVAPTGERTAG